MESYTLTKWEFAHSIHCRYAITKIIEFQPPDPMLYFLNRVWTYPHFAYFLFPCRYEWEGKGTPSPAYFINESWSQVLINLTFFFHPIIEVHLSFPTITRK